MITVIPNKLLAFFRRNCKNLRIMFPNKTDTVFILFTYNNTLRILQHSTKQGTDTCRTCTDNQYRIFLCDLRNTCSPVAGSENIPYQQRLSVRNLFRDLIQPLICKRHSHIFRLSPINTTAQRPATILICAVIYIAFFTEKTFSTKSFYIYRHSISRFYFSYSTAN